MNLLSILLEGAPQGGMFGSYGGLIMMVMIFVVFYFFMIRPQTQRQKKIRQEREAMKVGDKVVTSGGMYGKIRDIKDTSVIVEIAENVRIKVDKNHIFASAEDSAVETK